jgi:gas vesicle protein
MKEQYKVDMERIIEQHNEEIEHIKDKVLLEKDRALLEVEKQYQKNIEELTERYNEKINALQEHIAADNEKFKTLLEEKQEAAHKKRKPNKSDTND